MDGYPDQQDLVPHLARGRDQRSVRAAGPHQLTTDGPDMLEGTRTIALEVGLPSRAGRLRFVLVLCDVAEAQEVEHHDGHICGHTLDDGGEGAEVRIHCVHRVSVPVNGDREQPTPYSTLRTVMAVLLRVTMAQGRHRVSAQLTRRNITTRT